MRNRSRAVDSSGMVRAKFFMIAQLAYVLNLLPREKSNFSTARISDMFPSLTSSKKFSDGPTCRLAIDTTSRRLARTIWFLTATDLVVQPLDLVHQLALGRIRSSCCREPAGLVLQVVHLAEQVGFLFAGQQRHLVQARQVRRQSAGHPCPLGRDLDRGMGRRISRSISGWAKLA